MTYPEEKALRAQFAEAAGVRELLNIYDLISVIVRSRFLVGQADRMTHLQRSRKTFFVLR
jgi:hypothetical protein